MQITTIVICTFKITLTIIISMQYNNSDNSNPLLLSSKPSQERSIQ